MTEETVAAPAGEDVPAVAAASSDQPEAALRLAEALVFSSAAPIGARTLAQVLPTDIDAETVIAELRQRYAGRGVELVETAGGWQFRTALDLAPALRKVIQVPRRLPRVAMETLAIIAYHQPVTRTEIEKIRGATLSQQTLDALLESNLVAPLGRLEVPGRPTIWGTTPQFLTQFNLKDLRSLPRREDLLLVPPLPPGTEATRADADAAAAAADEPEEAASADEGPVPPAPASC